MKRIGTWILCVVLVAALIQASSAFTKSGEKVTPSGELKVNDAVKVSLNISIPRDYQFDMELTSNLKNQKCSALRDNTDEICAGSQSRSGIWYISNYVLSGKDAYSLQITFEGIVDVASGGKTITLLKIAEMEKQVVISEYKVERAIINPAEITSQITVIRANASKLLQDITTFTAQNVSTTAARSKYDEAMTAITQADAAKMTNFTKALSLLTTAKNAITDGNNLLQKGVIQKDIDETGVLMDQVDTSIDYFEVNRSLSTNDPRLHAIIDSYDDASKVLSQAQQSLTSGQYAQAKDEAADAKTKAQEALNLSTNLKKELGQGFALPGINPIYIFIGVGIVVIGVVGVLVYRKFFRWDELG